MSVANITDSAQYLVFKLGDESYAVDIVSVREVLEFTSVTKVPRTPDFMRGIINLRGGVVPVMDLRMKFGMSMTEKQVDTCVIIVETKNDGDMTIIGALADAVEEVLTLEPDQIEPPPRMGTKLDINFIRGVGKNDDKFIIILDMDRVLSASELTAIQALDLTSPPDNQVAA